MEAKEEEKYLDLVKRFVQQTKFGNISIIIQDGRVIQIEKNEKFRLKS